MISEIVKGAVVVGVDPFACKIDQDQFAIENQSPFDPLPPHPSHTILSQN
jgi:hypothetical protein